jgi:hypothetical protein
MQVAVALRRLGHEDLEQSALAQHLEDDHVKMALLEPTIRTFHESLLKTLTAQDARLGKAYGLGRSLSETMLIPDTQEPQSFARGCE